MKNQTSTTQIPYKEGQNVKIISGANMPYYNGKTGRVTHIEMVEDKPHIQVLVQKEPTRYVWCYEMENTPLKLEILN